MPGLEDADLVIAESTGAAVAAAKSGVIRHRLWVVAMPEEQLYRGAKSDEAHAIATAASKAAGFLVDSVRSQESVERATTGDRTRALLYPMIANDRTCPACAAASTEATTSTDDVPSKLTSLRDAAGAVRGEESQRGAVMPPIATWTAQTMLERPKSLDNNSTTDWTAAKQDRAAQSLLRTIHIRGTSARPARNVLITGFDLKFVQELANRLNSRDDCTVTTDSWPALSRASSKTAELVTAADTIFAEWARPSAVWLSEQKRPEQLLIVRLHRYEIDHEYPRQIAIDKVDGVVYIAPLMGRRIRDELGWPEDKLVYIPNAVDTEWFDRPKLPDARFGLGLVGALPLLKRLDLALDLLAEVRQSEPRFTLFIRSEVPWRNLYVWSKPEEREYYSWCFERIERNPLLRGAVHFDTPGRDMARWFRRIGHVLSISDLEGSHTALTEGMASGAVPVIRPWAGANEIYGTEWMATSTDEAAAAVLKNAADENAWLERAARAQDEVRRTHAPRVVEDAWADILHGDLKAARAHFAQYSGLYA